MKTPVLSVPCSAVSRMNRRRSGRAGCLALVTSLTLHAADAGAKAPASRGDGSADPTDGGHRELSGAHASGDGSQSIVRSQGRSTALVRFLTRETMVGPRFLDHGVLGLGVAGGFPHLYRLELSLGLLDYLTLGVTAHWLPGQSVPDWSPRVSLGFWRGRWLEIGAHYHQSLLPPVSDQADSDEQVHDVHWVLGSATFSQYYVAAGFDFGMAYGRESSPAPMIEMQSVVGRARLAGGLHLRAGTRRWGFTVQALWPYTEAELVFDVRFGVFEKRARGGWRPEPAVELQPRSHY